MADNVEFQAGERLYIGKTISDDRSINEHLDRYRFAVAYSTPDFVILDAACGSGYGVDFLARSARIVYGVEINNHAFQWAKEYYAGPRAHFIQADLNKSLPFPDAQFDLITSFETLEHVADQNIMLHEFRRVLKPGGLLIISSPDREVITDRAGADNKFHISELSKKEFIALLEKYFNLKKLYGQTKYNPLPWYKKLIKAIAKLDVFKVRRRIVQWFGLKLFIHKTLSPIAYTPIERIALEAPNDYYVLVAVCKKEA